MPSPHLSIRWNKVLRPGLHKGPWTEEEDNIVRECVEHSGAQKVAKELEYGINSAIKSSSHLFSAINSCAGRS